MTGMDKPLPEDAEMRAALPINRWADKESYARWSEAMRLVGAKHSKAALVELVNWLLLRIDMEPRLLQKDYGHTALQIQLRQIITELREKPWHLDPARVADRLEGMLDERSLEQSDERCAPDSHTGCDLCATHPTDDASKYIKDKGF